MTDMILFFIYGTVLVLFGVFLSAAFCGEVMTKRSILLCLGLCAFSGILQTATLIFLSADMLWKVYPLVTHLPLFVCLVLVLRKRVITSIAAISTVYLLCQPSKWFGLLAFYLTDSSVWEYVVRIVVIFIIAMVVIHLFAGSISQILNKDTKSVCIFAVTPVVYYLYDYITAVYTDMAASGNYVVAEFMPFFLVIVYMLFCLVYYKEYEQKADAERKEHIVQVTINEMQKEVEAVKRSEQEIRILRHDMRLLLNNLAVCISNNDKETAEKMISAHIDHIDASVVKHYCGNTTINYIVSSYAERCYRNHTEFICHITTDNICCDEIMLSTIISNAMDNAINAQQTLLVEKRRIGLMLKEYNGRLLFSVKNSFGNKPVLIDGVPLSDRKDHGFGTKSIIYLTEKMGGNCQFMIEDDKFVLRVIL